MQVDYLSIIRHLRSEIKRLDTEIFEDFISLYKKNLQFIESELIKPLRTDTKELWDAYNKEYKMKRVLAIHDILYPIRRDIEKLAIPEDKKQNKDVLQVLNKVTILESYFLDSELLTYHNKNYTFKNISDIIKYKKFIAVSSLKALKKVDDDKFKELFDKVVYSATICFNLEVLWYNPKTKFPLTINKDSDFPIQYNFGDVIFAKLDYKVVLTLLVTLKNFNDTNKATSNQRVK